MIAGYIITYNDDNIIRDAILSLKACCDRVVVAVSSCPYHGTPSEPDNTEKIAIELGCVVIKGAWKKESDHRNAAMSEAERGASLVIPFESDMIITKDNLDSIIRRALSSVSSAFRCKQTAFWRDRNHILLGDKYNPVIAVKPGVRVANCANVYCPTEFLDGVEVLHYNWCEPKDIRKKVTTYHHAPQIATDWYDKHYVTWVEGEKAILPDCVLEVCRV